MVSATADVIELSLDGDAVLATEADVTKAVRGFEVRLGGRMRYSLKKEAFEKFEIVAIGQHWGDHQDMQPARPGKSYLGVSIEIAGNRPGDKVPPQASRWLDGYYGKG